MAATVGFCDSDKFRYIYSCDLDVEVSIKIGTLEGKWTRPNYEQLLADPLLQFSGLYQQTGCAELYSTCQIYSKGKPLALPVRTSYKCFTTRYNWNEWITLPLKYNELPRDALLVFTVWDIYGTKSAIPVGGSTIPVFGKRGTFKQGIHDLKLWPGVEGDGKHLTTPGKGDKSKDQMCKLAKLAKQHRDGHMLEADWLDRLTFREIEMINEQEKKNTNSMYLMVEFPQFKHEGTPHSLVYYEKEQDINHSKSMDDPMYADLFKVPDYEILMENLAENKHHKLARSVRSGMSDRDLKPNSTTRDLLNKIVAYPPTKMLAAEEQDMIWKFRFYLSSQEKALVKFLKCVNWDLAGETKQALDLLNNWAPMDTEDALELLSNNFTNPTVRRYAVSRLNHAADEDLMLYLLQLVQALKYENFDDIKAALMATDKEVESCRTRKDTAQSDSSSINSVQYGEDQLTDDVDNGVERLEQLKQVPSNENDCDLATFLVNKARCNPTLANYLYWYLVVESEDHELVAKDSKVREMYLIMMQRFSHTLKYKCSVGCKTIRASLRRQQLFVDKLVALVKSVAREKGDRKKKIERFQFLLSDPEVNKFNFASFESLPLPLDPDIRIKGILPGSATLFKSALMPLRLTFLTDQGSEYVAIFKHGDDLRQDQLILQIITLMDKLLRRENLDLKLSPYKVLATSSKHGFVQFVESMAVAEVLANEGTIQNFFRKHAPNETATHTYGIQSEVMDTYVKSCAGYCVITYLLGVGDRHLDNLLLTKTGKLFHIDFGYILGRDPKPLPPPMKLSKEMVEAMGGVNSEHYQEFRKLCYTAFLHLRRHANLILNLFTLMIDANIPDIALEPDKTVKKVQDKFMLNLNDEEAVLFMQSLIDVSVTAVMAALVEQFHKIAQYWRR